MKKIGLVWLGIVISLLTACSTTHNAAPVVQRTSSTAASAAAVVLGEGHYIVKKGDTLYRIALEFGQGYRDLVAWNNLADPNDIKVGQVLRVVPPEGDAQIGTVSTDTTGIDVKPLDANSAAVNGAPSTMNKTGPRGDKQAYSESALAELERPDNAQTSVPVVPQVAAATGSEAPPVVEKNNKAGAGNEAATSWIWPVEGEVIGAFDAARKGIDIAGRSGQPVLAASDGKVMYAGSGIRGYGNLVIVKHANNLLSAYAHNKTILVKEGQSVAKAQKIAEMGTSDSAIVKLHFEIRQQGKPVDPSKYLPPR